MRRFWFAAALLCLPLVVGCEGCRSQTEEPDDKSKQEKPLPDFASESSRAFPADSLTVMGGIKPGHWVTCSQTIKSNKIDARGQYRGEFSASNTQGTAGIDASAARGETLPTLRPVVLPKGQKRRIDFRLLAPIPSSTNQTSLTLRSRLTTSGQSIPLDTGTFPIMTGEEYFFVILTTRPERFARFQVANWVRPVRDATSFPSKSANYRVVIPSTDGVLPLAETMLDWTSTAVVLWDDLARDALTPQQSTAIADWVRFGGHLIVNGAAGTESIATTRLADVLPLSPTGTIELNPDAGRELLGGWAVATDRSTEKQVAVLTSQSGRIAIDGQAAADAETLPESGNLVLSRRIGAGRVVQTRFDLTSDWIKTWGSFDSFVNGAILLRPRRRFTESRAITDEEQLLQRFVDYSVPRPEPVMNSRFRIAARDAILKRPDGAQTQTPSLYDPLTSRDVVKGVSAWNESSDVVRTSREILIDEAGIEIPGMKLIARSLAYYLLILVPVNYLVFRSLGRLEYAWLAVPVIAIGGAAWVARVARLDIGFARSQTEIAMLEMHAGYPRGHLSRMVAIYNSLSSRYNIQFETLGGAATPVYASTSEAEDNQAVFLTSFAEGPSLSGVTVASGRTQHVHAEQMIDAGGTFSLKEDLLSNTTKLELFDALVIEKSASGDVRVAVVGSMVPGSTAKLRFRPHDEVNIPVDLPMQTGVLLQRLATPDSLPLHSTRLVARIDGSVPGMTITPSSNQSAAQSVLLAHLRPAPLPNPTKDTNLITDIRPVNKLEDEETVDTDDPSSGDES